MAAIAAVSLVYVPPTLGKDGDDLVRGFCGKSSSSKLKLSPENGRIEVEFEVDQNVSGDRWRVKIRHDGDRVFRGTRTTGGASGSFEVRIVEDDRAGSDTFAARARNLSTDEVCGGSATF